MGPSSLSRKQWYDEIWKLSAFGTAKKYDIPYGPFMQQIKASGIPIPPSGYWTKLNFGKPVEVIPLPGDSEEILTVYRVLPKRKSGKQPASEASAAQTDPAEDVSDTPAPAAAIPSLPPETSERAPVPVTSEPADDPAGEKRNRSLYDREALYLDVWNYPIEDAASLYSVTASTLEKICRAIDIPLPQKRDSERLRAGQRIEKPAPLPERSPSARAIEPQMKCLTPLLQGQLDALDFLDEEDRAVLGTAAAYIRLPDGKERMLSPLIAHRRRVAAWRQEHKGENTRYRPHNAPQPPYLGGGISDESLPRVLHIIDALAKALNPLGGKIENDLSFVVYGERLRLDFSEARDTVLHTLTKEEHRKLLAYQDAKKRSQYASKPDFPKYDHPYNGRLTVKLSSGRSLRDGSVRLEERLGEILLAMYAAAEGARQERLKREETERKRREEERILEERRKRRELEVTRTIELENMAADYDTACKIRRYIEARIAAHPEEDLSEWRTWASAKADWFDPTLSYQDPVLGIREHAKDQDAKDLRESRRYRWS